MGMIRSAVTGLFLWVLPIALAQACTVAPEQGIPMLIKNESSDYLDSFDVVFLGMIVEREYEDDLTVVKATIEVSRSWKGDPGDSVFIETSPGVCSTGLLVGESYVFFADRTAEGEYGPRVDWATLAGAPELPALLDAALDSP
jgi:hypothetical protein